MIVLIVVILILWALGFFAFHLGAFIQLLLVVALILFIFDRRGRA